MNIPFDRRRFLRTALAGSAGLLLCRCEIFGSEARPLYAQSPGARRPVTIGGRTVRTVDVHSHVYVQEVWPLVKDRKEVDPALANLSTGPMGIDTAGLERRFTEMDRERIDVHVISVHPSQFFYWAEPDLAARLVKMQNEKIAELCAATAIASSASATSHCSRRTWPRSS